MTYVYNIAVCWLENNDTIVKTTEICLKIVHINDWIVILIIYSNKPYYDHTQSTIINIFDNIFSLLSSRTQ